MSTVPTQPNNKMRKFWIALAILVACVVVGLVIWRMIDGARHGL